MQNQIFDISLSSILPQGAKPDDFTPLYRLTESIIYQVPPSSLPQKNQSPRIQNKEETDAIRSLRDQNEKLKSEITALKQNQEDLNKKYQQASKIFSIIESYKYQYSTGIKQAQNKKQKNSYLLSIKILRQKRISKLNEEIKKLKTKQKQLQKGQRTENINPERNNRLTVVIETRMMTTSSNHSIFQEQSLEQTIIKQTSYY